MFRLCISLRLRLRLRIARYRYRYLNRGASVGFTLAISNSARSRIVCEGILWSIAYAALLNYLHRIPTVSIMRVSTWSQCIRYHRDGEFPKQPNCNLLGWSLKFGEALLTMVVALQVQSPVCRFWRKHISCVLMYIYHPLPNAHSSVHASHVLFNSELTSRFLLCAGIFW